MGTTPYMLNEHIVLVAAALATVGNLIYAAATFEGRTRPNRVTWALWALAPLIAFAAELKVGVGLPAVLTFAAGFGPLLVLAASLTNRSAYWDIGPLDIVCGVISLGALLVWALTRTGDVAILFSIIADALAAYPTIRKAYTHPETEHAAAFALMSAGSILTLLTIHHWTLASAGFPLYLVAVGILITGLIVVQPKRRSEEAGATDVLSPPA